MGSADLISSPEQALDVFELEAVARARLAAHFGYLASGTDGQRTVQANRDAFDRWFLRPRRLVDVTSVDTSVELLGVRWPTPIVLAPCGSQRAFHPEGELATARAARAANCLQILSTVTSTSVEEVAAARGTPLWYQLYPTTRWEIAETIVRRVTAAGVAAIVVTVDYPAAPIEKPSSALPAAIPGTAPNAIQMQQVISAGSRCTPALISQLTSSGPPI